MDYCTLSSYKLELGCMTIARDVPFVPTSSERLKVILELAHVQPGQRVVDLGSGDGRVVIAMAKLGAVAFGYESDPYLFELSAENIKDVEVSGDIFVSRASFWEGSFEDFDVVTVFGVPEVMGRLEEKLRGELKAGAKVISNYFTFPTWEPEVGRNNIYLYLKE